ncbi:MAG: hypothetical protein NT016_01395 [Candidatus Aenigmarchaeota archaeon]|nr:hypothetical protein [Candidatus Aenigmarchaeota archaeon]
MMRSDVDEEVDRLKARKVELSNRMNMTTSFDDKDELKEDIIRLDAQIATLERLQQLE